MRGQKEGRADCSGIWQWLPELFEAVWSEAHFSECALRIEVEVAD